MKSFRFTESFHSALQGMTAEERGDFILAISNFFFEGDAFLHGLTIENICDCSWTAFMMAKPEMESQIEEEKI